MTDDLPIVVVGGGPAGASATLALVRCGRRVVLAGGVVGDEFRVGEAIPPATRPLLRDLGVLDRFLADGHLPCYGNVSVWGDDKPVTTDFIFDPNGHGWHLDRVRFDATLQVAAREAGAEVFPTARLVEAVRESTGWRVTLTPGDGQDQQIRCGWLIDATGRRSTVARRAGATRMREDSLVAFYARFRSEAGADCDSRTMIESGPEGWWYTALVPSGERVVAFLTDMDLVDRAAMLSPAGFTGRLETSRYVRSILSAHRYEASGSPRGTDAGTAWLDCIAGSDWVAVGDAAVSFDPLSSQGIMTALFTGLRAGQAIDRVMGGDAAALDEYVRRVDAIRSAYRRNRAAYYAAENRWSDRPFWHRRHQAASKGIEHPHPFF